MHIPFYMDNTTAKALLKQSQAYTEARRAAKAEALEIAAVRAQFERIGWNAEAAQELAEIHVRGIGHHAEAMYEASKGVQR